jgi:hypothetical protein
MQLDERGGVGPNLDLQMAGGLHKHTHQAKS